MKAPIIVWRESVYKNNFKCNKCGLDLMKDGELNQTIRTDKGGKRLYCPRCGNGIAVITGEIEVPDETEGSILGGKWEEA